MEESKMSKKRKGNLLEIYITQELKEAIEDKNIRPTKASSGGSHNTEIGDILSKDYYIECKNHKKASISLKTWDKLINSIPMNSLKIPLYIIKRPTNEILVTLYFNDFCKILKDKNEK